MTELNDMLDLPADVDGLNHIYLGAEDSDELGQISVDITIPAGIHQETVKAESYDQVQVVEVAGTPVAICKEAIRVDGEAHLVPSRIIPWDRVLGISVPLDNSRMAEMDAEHIGVNK